MRKILIGRIAALAGIMAAMNHDTSGDSKAVVSLGSSVSDRGLTITHRQAPKKKQKCIKKQHKPNSQYKSTKPIKGKAVRHYRNKI